MKFHKAAAATALMLALPGCNGSESTASEPASPEEGTISMATACNKMLPLIEKSGDVLTKADDNNVSPGDPDTIDEVKYILDEMDAIAAKIDTEEGIAVTQELINAFDQSIEAMQKEGVWILRETPSANVSKQGMRELKEYFDACGFTLDEN